MLRELIRLIGLQHSYSRQASCNSLSLSISSSSTTCNGGSDGSIDLTATGGSGIYTYSWDNGSTSEDPSGLSWNLYCYCYR